MFYGASLGNRKIHKKCKKPQKLISNNPVRVNKLLSYGIDSTHFIF